MFDTFLNIFDEKIRRDGAKNLKEYLIKSDFQVAPASTRFHGDHEGGLCEHSINVYYRLREMTAAQDDFSEETLAICGLLHDLCKVGFYTVSTRNVKNEQTGRWEKKPYYTVEDKLPYGHGEKSVFMIERYMRLTIEEAMAIRFHMGDYSDQNTSRAFEKYPLALLLHQADERSTYLD